MSGGHFDYKESYLEYIAEQLEHDIKYNEVSWTEDEENYGHQLEPKTIDFLKEVIEQLYNLKTVLREYDLAVSGDSNEKTFQENVGIE